MTFSQKNVHNEDPENVERHNLLRLHYLEKELKSAVTAQRQLKKLSKLTASFFTRVSRISCGLYGWDPKYIRRPSDYHAQVPVEKGNELKEALNDFKEESRKQLPRLHLPGVC